MAKDNMHSKEQVGPRTELKTSIRKYGINENSSERERKNHNPSEGVIRELRKQWYQELFRTYCTRKLWSYEYPFVENIMQLTASQ